MVKFLTRHTKHKEFFSELRENEAFMYSYLDYSWDEVVKIAEENNIKIEYIKKGTEEYKKYGECSAKVIEVSGKLYEFKIFSGETLKVEARTEAIAKQKLMDQLFKKNYITLNQSK